MRHIEIFDTTLRDGAQAEGVVFSREDKIKVLRRLDELGVDFDGADVPKAHVERLADLIDRPTWRSIAKEAAIRMLGMFTIALAIVTASGMLAGLVQFAAAVIDG